MISLQIVCHSKITFKNWYYFVFATISYKKISKICNFLTLTTNCKPQTESTKWLSQVDLNRLGPMRLFAHSSFEWKTSWFLRDFTWNRKTYCNQAQLRFHNLELKWNVILWNGKNCFRAWIHWPITKWKLISLVGNTENNSKVIKASQNSPNGSTGTISRSASLSSLDFIQVRSWAGQDKMEQNRTKWDIMGQFKGQFKGVWNVTKQVKLGQRGIKPGHNGTY